METNQNKEKHICDFGCNKEATNQFKNGKWCCSTNCAKCPSVKERNWRDKSVEVRLKISQKVREANKRPEVIEKIKNRVYKKLTEEKKRIRKEKYEKTIKKNGTDRSKISKEIWIRTGYKYNISKTHEELWKDEAYKERQLRILNEKCWHNPERNKKVSQARINYYKNNPGITSGEKSSMYGKHHTKEWIKNTSNRSKEMWKNKDFRDKMKLLMVNSWKNPERIRKQKEYQTERSKNTEYIKQLREYSLKNWSDPKYVKKLKDAWKLRPNKPETILINLFKDLNLNFEYTGDFSFMINGKNPDFTNYENKKVIEFFGTYWHSEKFEDKNNEQSRIEHFAKEGYKCLIIWEEELKDIEKIIEKVIQFNKEI